MTAGSFVLLRWPWMCSWMPPRWGWSPESLSYAWKLRIFSSTPSFLRGERGAGNGVNNDQVVISQQVKDLALHHCGSGYYHGKGLIHMQQVQQKISKWITNHASVLMHGIWRASSGWTPQTGRAMHSNSSFRGKEAPMPWTLPDLALWISSSRCSSVSFILSVII